MNPKLAALLPALLASGAVLAQPKAPEPDYTLAFNVGAVSDYRYRGISQTRLNPTLQAGADFSHKSGFYLGTWASGVRWIKDAGVGAATDVEVDFYGGYKFNAGPVGVDVGALRYQYANSNLAVSPNTTELYAAGSWGPATLKYSHAVTNLFGFPNSKNSGYLDLSATFDTGFWGLTVTPHIGRQRVKNNSAFSYTDWSLALGKDFGNGLSASVAYVDTNTGNYRGPLPGNKDLGRAGVVLGVKYGF